jgi:hypothetical protein
VAGLGAYTGDAVVPQKGDLVMASTLVAKSAEIQAGYSKCDDDGKRKIATKCHTSMRTFDVGASFDGDEEKWTAYMNGGLVFGVACSKSRETVV